MTKKKTNSNKPEEIRLKVTNWDEAVPTMVCREHGANASRKVLTRGVIRSCEMNAGAFEEECAAVALRLVAEALRSGYEYRMCDDEGEDAVRFIPMVAKDMKTVYICAETMGAFRAELKDKIVTPFYRGEPVSSRRASDLLANKMALDRKYHSERKTVTPDTVVECPECGCEIRVGKQLQ